MSKISLLVRHIVDNIQLLYKFSSLLRRPAAVGRYLKSSTLADQPLPEAAVFDIAHIREKFRYWNTFDDQEEPDDNATENLQNPSLDQTAVTQEVLQNRLVTENLGPAFNTLSHRLAYANTQRREQFGDWKAKASRLKLASEVQRSPQTDQIPRVTQLTKPLPSQPKILPSSFDAPKSTTSKPVSTEKAFSSIPQSDLFEAPATASNTRQRTVYAPSMASKYPTSRVPSVPKATAASFTCPYCHLELDTATMQDRMVWK